MDDGKVIWSKWQSLLTEFQPLFTRGGWVRFVQWVTGMALCDEEHTITQILTTLGLESRWRVSEAFAEYGAGTRGRRAAIVSGDRSLGAGLLGWLWRRRRGRHQGAPPCAGRLGNLPAPSDQWSRPQPRQGRAGAQLGGAGRLVPGRPWTCLPAAARLYIRRNALPADETFLTKNQLAVAMLRQADRDARAPLLAVLDGAFARANVLRPCLNPAPGERRIDFVTRPRHDARLYKPPVIKQKKASCGGRPRQWGQRLASPKDHARWNVPWQRGRAYIYGRMRSFRARRVLVQWAVTGKDHLVHAYVFEVEGYRKPWYLICSARSLCASQVVAAGAARFRQEDGFRDQKQRLGMEECRAWTKEPILRTFQVQLVAQALLRVMELHLNTVWGKDGWWTVPDWNRRKRHPSLLDLLRLFWRHRQRFSQFMVRLEELAKPPQARFPRARALAHAA